MLIGLLDMNVAIWANKDSDYNRLNNHAILGGHFAPVRGGQFTPEMRGSVCAGKRGSICPEFPLGRFLSIDPLFKEYPFYSPYQYNSNTPIWIVDLLGLGDPLTVMQIRGNRASNLQGMVRNGGTRPHQGYDLAAAPGTSTLAVKNAIVHATGNSASYGNYITLRITNEDGTTSYAYYAHLDCIGVEDGQNVTEGQEIGTTGQTGNAQGQALSEAHLHFEYRSEPTPGLGLAGRLDPNDVLDTKFYSQDLNANQTNTGVIRVNQDGSRIAMNLDGTTIEMAPIQEIQMIQPRAVVVPQVNVQLELPTRVPVPNTQN